MNKEIFNQVFVDRLVLKEKETIRHVLQGLSNKQIADRLFLHPSTVSIRITSIRKKFARAELESKRESLSKEQFKTELNYLINIIDIDRLVQYFHQYTNLPIDRHLLEKHGLVNTVPYPEGAEEANSPWYLESEYIKLKSRNTLNQSGSLLRINAPKQMGKTSLINQLFDYAIKNSNYAIYFSLNSLDTNTLKDYGKFLNTFCEIVTEELSELEEINKLNLLPLNLDKDLHQECTKFFKLILQKLPQPLVFIIDDLERIFEFEFIYRRFFPLLRSWHEKWKRPGESSKIWKKLKLIIAYSTEDYHRLDENRSPLNVGELINLQDFSREEVIELAQKYGIDDRQIISDLIDLVGGHPYLIKLALYHLAQEQLPIETLIKEAITDSGIYQKHLRRHLETLQSNSNLCNTFKKILNSETPIVIKEQKIRFQLQGMGLIKISENRASIKSKLYQLYFANFIN